jgi:hypothetical protein
MYYNTYTGRRISSQIRSFALNVLHEAREAPDIDGVHMFTNLGDGTCFHSGLLAIHWAAAAKLNTPTRCPTIIPWP